MDAYKMAINIENNRKASGKLGRRDDPKLFNPRGNRRQGEKPTVAKKLDDNKMDQVLNLLKNMNPPTNHANKQSTSEKFQFNTHYNKNNRIQNFPYTTQWKDGKPVVPPAKNTGEKSTADPLQKTSINMADDS